MTSLSSRRPAVAGFAIFTLVMVAAFTGLGIWQLQRRVEKHALIARLIAPPMRHRPSTLRPSESVPNHRATLDADGGWRLISEFCWS